MDLRPQASTRWRERHRQPPDHIVSLSHELAFRLNLNIILYLNALNASGFSRGAQPGPGRRQRKIKNSRMWGSFEALKFGSPFARAVWHTSGRLERLDAADLAAYGFRRPLQIILALQIDPERRRDTEIARQP
jgi:hypothetical protein